MARFTLPRDIYFGENSLETLKDLDGKKAVIVVGGGSMKRFGFLDKVVNYLKEAGIESKLIEGVEPDPSVETVMNGAKLMREYEPDLIVSIGGGSPIDAAKAMWIFYEYPEFTFKEAVVPFGLPKLRQKATFIAIPSTSGTATEVTAFSVITDYKAKIKYPLADFNLTPDIAIIDPALAQTMPPKLTAHTGMDALTHAIEAYVAGLHSVFSDPLAIQAIVMVNQYLIKSYNEDKEARNQMHLAQCLAGMAFSNALLGITHSLAHKTGAVFHIPHGCANAIYLPYVIDFNKKACTPRYADIARSLKLPGNTDDELVDSLTNMIKDMNKSMDIPLTLKDYGVDEKEFKDNEDFIAHNAVLDACTGSNPRSINDAEMKKLLEYIYYGKKVDF
ncbi:iron-containing alcohol dehydrogenase [Clostridium autoethanogenum]|jgi:alcohol dehydrogenase class IV|uniref:Iron-containing alcohol dehydrogenase n=1 Tax=Clostridium autoethanogenum DSM 10061 TaxID=1341692 RepID=A0ABN4BK58_9CLOT|nr:iron-containing alcohol dehydrogenase [Clostridium autoethanogenum]AGY78155.1 iron-containing alcohol dehydrogenase [Clostridium autoethanogenum DSM 10061]ALU38288.1 Alcohol dehydrogenase [Clostridium autoethanogenum DSM 10061]OVY51051.1 Aldehyde-alcohol dehydrogenase [Clostridium autoethanogenum]